MNIFSTYSKSIMADGRARAALLAIFIIILVVLLIVGMIAYRYLFQLSWVDAFYSATLVLTTVNTVPEARTVGQKIFVAIYALISIVVFFSLTSVIVSFVKDRYAK